MKLSAIVEICKYRGFHEGHHFIPIAMEVHGAHGHDMDCFISSVFVFSMIDDKKFIYPCLFAFNFFGIMLVLLFNML